MNKALVKLVIIAGFLTVLPFGLAKGEDVKLNAYLFWGDGCPHCAKERLVVEELKKQYPEVKFYDFEIYYHPENVKLMQQTAQALAADVGGVPFTVIGNQPFVGFSEEITPAELEDRIRACLKDICPDSIATITGVPLPEGQIKTEPAFVPATPAQTTEQPPQVPTASSGQAATTQPEGDPAGTGEASAAEKKFYLPVLGEVNAKTVSLPLLTVVLGLLDGFNPCALWTLLFLISLLLGMQDRKRMWILGSSFIMASASVYFLFMAAWLNLILFLGFVIWVRAAIGLVAIGGGSYSTAKFFTKKDSGCEVTGNEERQKVFQKLKNIAHQKSFWVALGGIIILAFAVNLVELICSAGLPAVYTQVLALSGLPQWQYYLYILLYIFFFMLDDLFVFFAAMITLRMTGLTTKYARYSSLVGGLLMVIIGIILIFRPQLLMFG